MIYTFLDDTNQPAVGGVLFKDGKPMAGVSDKGTIDLTATQAQGLVFKLIGYEDKPLIEGVFEYVLSPKSYDSGVIVDVVANRTHVKLWLLILVVVALLSNK